MVLRCGGKQHPRVSASDNRDGGVLQCIRVDCPLLRAIRRRPSIVRDSLHHVHCGMWYDAYPVELSLSMAGTYGVYGEIR